MNKATSVYLDAVRLLAACLVFVVHVINERLAGKLPVVWRLADLGDDAVMVFFVLSGFVIAYVVDTKERTLEAYAVSRAARLYSVALPALILTAVCDSIGTRLSPALYNGWWYQADQPLWRAFANLFFINELWFSSVRPFSNGPFWSLGFEVWYYAIFAAFTYCTGRARWGWTALMCLIAGPKILLLLPVWIYGALAYRASKRAAIGPRRGLALAAAAALGYWTFRTEGGYEALTAWTEHQLSPEMFSALSWSQDFLACNVMGALAALHFLGAARFLSALSANERMARAVAHLASFTFGMYLFHYPLIQCLGAVADFYSLGPRAAFITIGALLGVIGLCTVTERRKHDVKRLLLRAIAATRNRSERPHLSLGTPPSEG
jgi:peptidoglycan/LPS O-acetylase OafA/YrhL